MDVGFAAVLRYLVLRDLVLRYLVLRDLVLAYSWDRSGSCH